MAIGVLNTSEIPAAEHVVAVAASSLGLARMGSRPLGSCDFDSARCHGGDHFVQPRGSAYCCAFLYQTQDYCVLLGLVQLGKETFCCHVLRQRPDQIREHSPSL